MNGRYTSRLTTTAPGQHVECWVFLDCENKTAPPLFTIEIKLAEINLNPTCYLPESTTGQCMAVAESSSKYIHTIYIYIFENGLKVKSNLYVLLLSIVNTGNIIASYGIVWLAYECNNVPALWHTSSAVVHRMNEQIVNFSITFFLVCIFVCCLTDDVAWALPAGGRSHRYTGSKYLQTTTSILDTFSIQFVRFLNNS